MAGKLEDLRSYEISIWTLQDRFISVLKWATLDQKGQIENAKFTKSDDGTRDLEFSIPKNYYLNGQKILNPMWHQLEDQPLDANMHKLKIIFNKNTPDESIEEMFITSVTMTHSGDIAMIDVKAEGLAFHELGKIGYKIELAPEIYYNELDEWFDNGALGEQPINNIEYWNNIIFGTNINRLIKSLTAGVNQSKLDNLIAEFANVGITILQNDLSTKNGLYYLNTQRPTITAMNIDNFYKTNWTYEIKMDWSSFSQAPLRASDIIYEDEYVSSWQTTEDGTGLIPRENVSFREKYRNIEIKESNIYNITQTIAEQFGVFCRYEYEHDDRYQIIGRKVIYYNNYLMDLEGHFSLTYPYSTTEIKRTIDNTDTITKMFVKTVDSNADDANIVSIMTVAANRSMEDYLLNFDYLKETNNITQEQIEAINQFEADMRTYNLELISLEERIRILENELNELQAKKVVQQNAIMLDQERYDNANAELRALTGDTGAIIVDGYNAKVCVLKTEAGQPGRAIDFPFTGVDFATVKLYTTINYTDSSTPLSGLITGGIPIKDDFGNVVGIRNLNVSADYNTLYLTCAYAPKLYWEKIAKIWLQRLLEDQRLLDELEIKIGDKDWQSDETEIETKIDELIAAIVGENQEDAEDSQVGYVRAADSSYNDGTSNTYFNIGIKQKTEILNIQYKALLEKKQIKLQKFERLMGPALREGYWQPEDYNDYGDIYNDTVAFGGDKGTTPYLSFIWDTTLFDDEIPVIYQASVDGKMEQHLMVDISGCLDTISQHLDDLSFVFYNKATVDIIEEIKAKGDYSQSVIDELNNTTCIQSFRLGAGCELGYVNHYDNGGNLIRTGIPVLIITGATTLTEDQINFIMSSTNTEYKPFLGYLELVEQDNSLTAQYKTYVSNLTFMRVNGESIRTRIADEYKTPETYQYRRVVPRLYINSLKLKNGGETLKLNLNNQPLTILKEFSIVTDERSDENEIKSGYYVTPKAEVLFKTGFSTKTFQIQYILSNADVSIYLDAIQIMRENAYPKVTYEVSLNLLDPSFIHTIYNQLNRVVHINDNDLQLENVYGYISSITMLLDKPWEDTIEVKNYETKFEDLFSTIVAQSEAMKKNSGLINSTLRAFAPNGDLKEDTLQSTMRRADLNYSFNQGTLTIDNENGIWGTSDAGVVAFRGGGIFTAYEKDINGNWVWNTGILPTGIDANLITTGQLDTNKIKVYAGDQLRFQLNRDGLFAYKTRMADVQYLIEQNENNSLSPSTPMVGTLFSLTDVNDYKQYVKFYEEGLFLIAEKGAQRLDTSEGIANAKYVPLLNDVKRVEVSWRGFILRNWDNEEVFYADPDTGNLTLEGRIETSSGHIGGWEIGSTVLQSQNINLISRSTDESESGIFLTPSTSALQTITYNDATYYAYSYGENSCYANELHIDGFYPGSGTIIIASTPRLSAVSPKYIYVYQEDTSDSTNGEEHLGYGTTDEDAEVADEAYIDGGTAVVSTVTKTYVVGSAGSTIPLTYNGSAIEYDYNTTTESTWYQHMILSGYENLIDTTYIDAYQQVEVDSNTWLTPREFTPSFSLQAETGEIRMNNGIIGSFNFDNLSLRDGKLDNTELGLDNYTILNVNGERIRKTLADYSACFSDFTSNSEAGTFTLTRVNGTSVNFNIAAMAAYQNARAAAGTLTLISSSHNNVTCSVTVQSGYGTVATYTIDISDVYVNGVQNGSVTGGENLDSTSSGGVDTSGSSSGICVNCAATCFQSCGKVCDKSNGGGTSGKPVTDTCNTNCIGHCATSCTGGCGGVCANSCNSGCSDTCEESCYGTCTGYCSTTCTGGCSGGCSTECTGGCKSGCYGTCIGTVRSSVDGPE